jgi:hypothetical protein
MAVDRNTRGFNLIVRDISAIQGLKTIFPEIKLIAFSRKPGNTTAL